MKIDLLSSFSLFSLFFNISIWPLLKNNIEFAKDLQFDDQIVVCRS